VKKLARQIEIRFVVRAVLQIGGTIIHLILEPETSMEEHPRMPFMPISTSDDEKVMIQVMQGVQKGLMGMDRPQHHTCIPLKPEDYEALNKPTVGEIVVVALECISMEKK
jgi:hypothetical protein